MFNRITYQESALFFSIVAFAVALGIFVVLSWRALRMKPLQVARFEKLPFGPDESRPPHGHP